jgi:hypothetical protein
VGHVDGTDKNAYKILYETPRKDHLEDFDVDGRMEWTGFIWFRIGGLL